jgi:hypothetical protein
VLGEQPIVLLVHQGRGDHEVRRGPVVGYWDIPQHCQPQQGLDVRIVRVGLQRVPQEDQEVDDPLRYPRADLLVATQRSALELGDLYAQLSLQHLAGHLRREHVVLVEQVPVVSCPLQQIEFGVVVGHEGHLLPPSHRYLLVFYGIFTPFP